MTRQRKTRKPTDDGHNESCLDMARRLGEEAGTAFEELPQDEQMRLLRAQLVKDMPFLAALYEDAAADAHQASAAEASRAEGPGAEASREETAPAAHARGTRRRGR